MAGHKRPGEDGGKVGKGWIMVGRGEAVSTYPPSQPSVRATFAEARDRTIALREQSTPCFIFGRQAGRHETRTRPRHGAVVVEMRSLARTGNVARSSSRPLFPLTFLFWTNMGMTPYVEFLRSTT